MKYFVVLFGVLAFSAVALGETQRKHYYGYKVYRVNFTTEEQFKKLYDMRINTPFGMDVWQLSHKDHYADIMVSPEKNAEFLKMMDENKLTYEIKIPDVERTIDETDESDEIEGAEPKKYTGYKVYHITFDTDAQFESLRQLQASSNTEDFSFWQLSHVGHYADIMVSPEKQPILMDFIHEYKLSFKCIIEDVEKEISENKTYKECRIYKVHFTTEKQFEILNKLHLETTPTSKFRVLQLVHVRKEADIFVTPGETENFVEFIKNQGFTFECLVGHEEKEEKKSYKGYQVFRVTFTTDEQFEFLRGLSYDSNNMDQISIWQLSKAQKYADVLVAPQAIEEFKEFMKARNFDYHVTIEDVGEFIKQ